MARLELIKELKIRRGEIYNELAIRFPELMDELSAIDKIIDSSKQKQVVSVPLPEKKENKGTPKGDYTWVDYVLLMLKEIGGKGKSSDVAKAIFEANDDITLQRAKDASSDKLSRLLSANRVKAIKSTYKKDGYTYEII